MGSCIPPKHDGNANKCAIRDIKILPGLFVQKASGDPYRYYELINYIGEGGYGKVYKVRHRKTGQLRAMKIISKISSHSNEKENDIIREINILKELDHPGIIKIFEFFSSEKQFFLLTELCTGGELFDKIIQVKHFSESVAANIMSQLLSAIHYCHSNQVIHRDLKPENILIETNEEKDEEFFTIKIIDFGTSEILKRNKMLKEQIGTSFYIAPEVLKNSYNEKCDLWSCGVILYILLCGGPPFYGSCEDEIFMKISTCNYTFKHPIWKEISNEAKNLISQLLKLDVHKRPSAKEALDHEWFSIQNISHPTRRVSSENLKSIVKNIKCFKAEQKLQQATMTFLVHNLSTREDIVELREVFISFDENKDGRLTKDELIKGMSQVISHQEASSGMDEIMKTIDLDNNGYIEFEEFLSASIDKEKLLTETNLKIAFDLFDKDRSGGISASELKQILGGSNSRMKDSVWKEMIREIDLNGDGQISFEEFKQMMYKVVEKERSVIHDES